MNYKMVVLDLDGTLLNDDKKISPMSIKVLEALREKNIEIVVATGRRYRFARSLFESTGFPITVLSSGGTLVRNTGEDKKLLSRYIDSQHFQDVIRIGRELSLFPVLHVDKYEEECDFLLEFEKESPCYSSYITGSVRECRIVGDFLKYRDCDVLLMCYMGGEEALESFEARIRERHGRRLNTHIMTTLKRIGPVLEIMNPLGNKWHSLADYAGSINISPREIVALGDDNNDIEMIKNAGLGIAMKNATEKVKAAADFTSRHTNNEDGVALALAKLFSLKI